MTPTRSIPVATLAAVLVLALHGAPLAAAVQDDDNLQACCLATEWTLPDTAPSAVPFTKPVDASPQRCQVPIGSLSCCVGAEWVPFTAAEALPAVPPPATAGPDEPFCCMASEWSVR